MTENILFKSEEFLNGYNMLNPSNRPGRKGEVNGTDFIFLVIYSRSIYCD